MDRAGDTSRCGPSRGLRGGGEPWGSVAVFGWARMRSVSVIAGNDGGGHGMALRASNDRLQLARRLVHWSFHAWFYAMIACVSVPLVRELSSGSVYARSSSQDVIELLATLIGTACALSAVRITTRIRDGREVVGVVAESRRCGGCGSVVIEGSRACGECGGGMRDAMSHHDWREMGVLHQRATISLATLLVVQGVSVLLLAAGWSGEGLSLDRALRLAGMSTYVLLPSFLAARWLVPWLRDRRLKRSESGGRP